MPERAPVSFVGCGEADHRGLVGGLQHPRAHSGLEDMAPPSSQTVPAKGVRTPTHTYQQPENGEQVIIIDRRASRMLLRLKNCRLVYAY